jgi:hypothetical protein
MAVSESGRHCIAEQVVRADQCNRKVPDIEKAGILGILHIDI